jgi:hypothetical protein
MTSTGTLHLHPWGELRYAWDDDGVRLSAAGDAIPDDDAILRALAAPQWPVYFDRATTLPSGTTLTAQELQSAVLARAERLEAAGELGSAARQSASYLVSPDRS